MRMQSARLIVQLISLFRLGGALLFSLLASTSVGSLWLAGCFGLAAISDLLDGLAARLLGVPTRFGAVVDLVSDKALTTVSLLFAASRGITIAPLGIIATREIVMIGMRLIAVDGTQVLPTSRLFGGILVAALWGNTLLLLADDRWHTFSSVQTIYWLCALVFTINLAKRFHSSRSRISVAFLERP